MVNVGSWKLVAGLMTILGTISTIVAGFYYSFLYTGYWVVGWDTGRIISLFWAVSSFTVAFAGVLLLVFLPSQELPQAQVEE